MSKLKISTIACMAMLLVACQSAPVSTTALIPISRPAERPEDIPRPYLPIIDVPEATIKSCETTGSLCGDLVKALDASLEAAWTWGKQQEKILDGYRGK